MLGFTVNGTKFKSLADQIIDAELQILERQRIVITCTDSLIQKTQQQMTVPSNLLLAGGIGFVFGELTKSKSLESHSITDEPRSVETANITTILMSVLNQLTTINALYATFRASMKQTETIINFEKSDNLDN